MQLFYSKEINDNNLVLDKIESHHCIKVLRHEIGDEIKVVDGFGNLFLGKIIKIKNNCCYINIESIKEKFLRKNYYVHIALSPIKNHERLEWFVEKSIEIGVDEISFIDCDRTLRKNIRKNRINKVAISAMKQTVKAYLPTINDIVSFKSFIKSYEDQIGYICHLENRRKFSLSHFRNKIKSEKSFVMIGPEGDFSKEEINLASENSIRAVTLGQSRLRTETAGIIACHLMNLLNE